MNNTALLKLARLSGAKSLPSRYLYNGEWPSSWKRFAQVIYWLGQWLRAAGAALYISGPELRAGRGHVALNERPTFRGIVAGGCVLRCGSLKRLAAELQLLPSKRTSAYLADADVLVVLGEAESGPVVVHIADDQSRIDRYVTGCEHGRAALENFGYGHLLPIIRRQGVHAAGYTLTQQRIDGYYLASTSSLDAEKFIAHVSAAFEPLICLENPLIVDGRIADAELHRELNAVLMGTPELREVAEPVLAALGSWPLLSERAAVLAHGDYWMANLLFIDTPTIKLSGILDWERMRLHATVGADAMHLLMFSYSQWKGCSEAKVLCMILDSEDEPTLKYLLSKLQEDFSLSSVDVCYLAAQAWLMFVARYVSMMPGWTDTKRADWLVSARESVTRWAAGATSSNSDSPERVQDTQQVQRSD